MYGPSLVKYRALQWPAWNSFMTSTLSKQTAFKHEVASRFGLVPNFFLSAPDAPEIIPKLWDFAKAAYFDIPIPSLFKERLFIYLSRFCEVRYCITRHCGFLLGYGHSAGDPSASVQTVAQVVKLLKTPTPWQRELAAVFNGLEASTTEQDWPEPESELEDWIFAAAALIFVEPARSERARRALRVVLGGQRFEHLMGLLTFIRTAHYWIVLHPDIPIEEDVRELLSANQELARLLLEDPEAARCEMSTRLFEELKGLRELHERRELEQAKRELEAQVQLKELLLKEVNHRVKNSLQIVSSILQLQVPLAERTGTADVMRSAAARVMAIAAVHERLYTGDNVRTVVLDTFLRDLCREIARAFDCAEGINIDAERVEVPTDMAVPLALIVNELVTNVIKHVGPPCRIELRGEASGGLKLRISDKGQGPTGDVTTAGMGSRIVDALVIQLGGSLATNRGLEGYAIELTVPSRAKA
jgi:two-component sensor histidine kinase